MKGFFDEKKWKRSVSLILICCVLATAIRVYPAMAQGITKDAFQTNSSSIELEDSANGSVKATWLADALWWERISTANWTSWNAETGIHVEITDITIPDESADWSLAIAFGNSNQQWSDKAGYMMTYANDGTFEVFPTKTSSTAPVGEGNELISVKREELVGSLTLDMKLISNETVGDKYIITVNDSTYTIPAVYSYGSQEADNQLTDPVPITFGFAILGGMNTSTGDVNWEENTKEGTSFVISDLSNDYNEPHIDASEEDVNGEFLTLEDMSIIDASWYATEELTDGGVKYTHNSSTPAYARTNTKAIFNAENSIHVRMKDIACSDEDYSVAVAIGNGNVYLGAVAPDQWYDKNGYMMFYGKSGDFSIVATNSTEFYSNGTIISLKREALGSTLSIDMKLQDDNYVITVNGDTYMIPAVYSDENKAIVYPKALCLAFGIMDGGPVAEIDSSKTFSDATFTIAKVTNDIPVTDITVNQTSLNMTVNETFALTATVFPENATNQGTSWSSSDETVAIVDDSGNITAIGKGTTSILVSSKEDSSIFSICDVTVFGEATYEIPEGLKCIQDTSTKHWKFQESTNKIRFTHLANGFGWERVQTEQRFYPEVYDVQIEMQDIISDNANYSLAIAFGSQDEHWYDKSGYMLIYGQNGHLAIIATDSSLVENLTSAPVVVSDVREALGETLTLHIKLNDGQYEITVNGVTYYVPEEHETYPIFDPESIYLAFGVVGPLTLNADTNSISSLNYHDEVSERCDVSFVIDKNNLMSDKESLKTLKPFADYIAFMSGYKDGTFKPEQEITRGEAIVAMAKLLVDESDIQELYTSDFTDISTEDENYNFYVYMEKCDFLPDFGTELNPQQSMTCKEFAELLFEQDEVPEWFVVEDSTSTITRAEAARAFCLHLGKTMPLISVETTFTDVTEETEYANYIWLATNEIAIPKVKYTVTVDGEETIQECIEQAITLSQTQDVMAIIELEDGVYQLTEPVTIDGQSYGEYELQIVIRNAEGTSPVISGNIDLEVSNFTKVAGQSYYKYQLQEDAKIGDSWPQFRDLYLNGERLQLAKSDEYQFTRDIEEGINGFYVDSTAFERFTDIASLELCINIEWMSKRYRVGAIESMDTETSLTEISIQDEEWHAYTYYDGNKKNFTGWPYWFENHLALLDEPGEFYYDSTNGVIYFYPYTDTDMSSDVISYPAMEKLFDMKNASAVTFEGLIFTGVTSNFATEHGFNGTLGGVHGWNDSTEQTLGEEKFYKVGEDNPHKGIDSENLHAAAIYSEDADHISIRNCVFDELGTNGVYMNGGNHQVVMKGNSFTNLAMSAAVFGKQGATWSQVEGQSNIIINNNYVYNIGTDYLLSPGFSIARVKNIAVTHNSIVHTPYSALMMGWINTPGKTITVHNAEVAYNHCEDNVYALNDGAALYFCGANALTDDAEIYNNVYHNYIKSNGYDSTYTGIYLDMNASNYNVYQNVIDGIVTTHGPIFNQNISTQLTYNNILRENYTTMSAVTSEAVEERNIQLVDNVKVASYDKLPKEAYAIIEAAGQQGIYAECVPEKNTVIKVTVENPHITLKQSEKSELESVVFTITNNSTELASYSVVSMNDSGTVQFVPSVEFLELAAGETGVISGCFYSDTPVTSGECMNLKVVQNNGWEMEYRRLIEVAVTLTCDQAGSNIEYAQNKEGIVVTGGYKTTHAERIPVYRAYSAKGDGIDVEITDISSKKVSSQDTDYSIAVMLGEYNAWYDTSGVMLVYGRSGNLSILVTESELASPDDAQVILTDAREALEDGERISINVREDGDVCKITVNGKTYEISADYLLGMEKLNLGFGIMGDKTSDSDTFEKKVNLLGSITFTIAEVSDNRPGNIVVDYTDTFSDYRSAEEGAEMLAPEGKAGYIFAGWYYDTNCKNAVSEGTLSLADGEKVYAKFVDEDVLSVQVQSKYTDGTDKSKMDLRFVTSVDSLKYQNAGFIVTANNGQSRSYSRTTSYTWLTAAGIDYRPRDRFSACSISFITIKLTNIGLTNPSNKIQIQAFWTTLDGTKVTGRPRTITIQEALDTMQV